MKRTQLSKCEPRRRPPDATIYPAAIGTELLGTISDKDTVEQMGSVYDTYQISPDRIASAVAIAIDQPEDTTINELTVGRANQPR